MLTIKKFLKMLKKKQEVKVCCDERHDLFELKVCVSYLGFRVIVYSMSELFGIVRRGIADYYGDDVLTNPTFLLTCRGKLLHEHYSLTHYVWGEENLLEIRFCQLRGGSGGPLVHQANMTNIELMNAHIRRIEQQCINETKPGAINPRAFEIQARGGEESEYDIMMKFIMDHIVSLYPGNEKFLILVENFQQMLRLTLQAQTFDDMLGMAQISYKLFTGKSSTMWIVNRVNAMCGVVQSGETIAELLSKARGVLNFAEEVGENPFLQEIYRFVFVLTCSRFLEEYGFRTQ